MRYIGISETNDVIWLFGFRHLEPILCPSPFGTENEFPRTPTTCLHNFSSNYSFCLVSWLYVLVSSRGLPQLFIYWDFLHHCFFMFLPHPDPSDPFFLWMLENSNGDSVIRSWTFYTCGMPSASKIWLHGTMMYYESLYPTFSHDMPIKLVAFEPFFPFLHVSHHLTRYAARAKKKLRRLKTLADKARPGGSTATASAGASRLEGAMA